MQTYLELSEFCKLVHLNEEVVLNMVNQGKLKHKYDDNKLLIEANSGAFSLIAVDDNKVSSIKGDFVEKTIGTILNLHESILNAKDETLEALRDENVFLKEALYSMQELNEENRNIIKSLTQELELAREELVNFKRKYKLMWEKTIEKHKAN
ncbi:DUF3972 domain-containing protein [Campylobacter sp. MG1]|uniref:DUF3972 domain-containing protein n=1 Tax=Campylobacter sp. MG1 TaxID=2976332 RepID=UPI00226CF412|nr:DUF3972 domain-containing protein [Campylobacter sp. MG1]